MVDLIERQAGNLTFLSVHPVLDQMARDIITGLPPAALTCPPVLIYCGVHQTFGPAWDRPGQKLAIQTEQLFDESGTALWPMRRQSNLRNILRATRRSTRVLDLSAFNRTFYEANLGRPANRRKVSFGPHIFPSSPPAYMPPARDDLLFFGWTGGKRRKGVLSGIRKFRVSLVEDGTFLDDLDAQIRAHSGVLNIHFEDGIYTEAPRLLSALVNGTPVVSERLDPGFEPGRHYHLLGSDAPYEPERLFSAFSAHVSQQFNFADWVMAKP